MSKTQDDISPAARLMRATAFLVSAGVAIGLGAHAFVSSREASTDGDVFHLVEDDIEAVRLSRAPLTTVVVEAAPDGAKRMTFPVMTAQLCDRLVSTASELDLLSLVVNDRPIDVEDAGRDACKPDVVPTSVDGPRFAWGDNRVAFDVRPAVDTPR